MDRVVDTIWKAVTTQKDTRIDRPVTTQEALTAIIALPTREAARLDGLRVEIFKDRAHIRAKTITNAMN